MQFSPKRPNPNRVKIPAIVGPAKVTLLKRTSNIPVSATIAAFTNAPPIPMVVKS